MHTKILRHSVLALAVFQSFSSNSNAADISLSNSCSLRDAIVAANSDTFTNGCVAGNGDDTIIMQTGSVVTLTDVDPAGALVAGLPVVSSNLTIQGNGSTITRDVAAPGFRFFTLASNVTFAMDSVTLTNGVGKGSAIHADGATLVNLSNCVVSGHGPGSVNGVTEDSDIGIHLENTNLELQSTIVTNNSGRNDVGVTVNNGSVIVIDSEISYNSASNADAGLYVSYNSVDVRNSSVTNNTARTGGGLMAYGPSSFLVDQSNISNNSGIDAGLYVYQGGSDGALTATITDTNVNNNSGSSSGLYIYAESETAQSMVTISSVTANNNRSPNSTGVELSGPMLSAEVNTLDVISNYAGNGNAGIWIRGGATVQMRNLTLQNNTNDTGASTTSTGIRISSSNLTLSDSNISNNAAILNSSALSMTRSFRNPNGSVVQVINTQITGNAVSSSNSGERSSIRVNDSSLTLNNVFLDNNYSGKGGGGISALGESVVTVQNSTISNNSTNPAYSGGGLLLGLSSNATISNTTFSGNSAAFGAAISANNADSVQLTNVSFVGNTETDTGAGLGTLTVRDTVGSFTVNNTLFSGNTGNNCGASLPMNVGANNWFNDVSCNGVSQGPLIVESLADNGGPTLTHALPSDSPAIDAGNASLCVAAPINGLDQRGKRRDNRCDIGAYEFIEEASFFIIKARNGKTVAIPL